MAESVNLTDIKVWNWLDKFNFWATPTILKLAWPNESNFLPTPNFKVTD